MTRARPPWAALDRALRAEIERLAGGRVVAARSCAGGFSPGFAARLTVAGGGRVFAKAIDARRWPDEVAAYRAEVRANAALPPGVPAPRLLGAVEDERWVALAFEDVDGVMPGDPWTPDALDRVLAATADFGVPAGPLERDHPRLGGWATLTADHLAGRSAGRSAGPSAGPSAGRSADPGAAAVLPRPLGPWAAAALPRLVALERDGLAAARGDSLVHGDLYPHNILLTPDRVVVVDWPHARPGSPVVDLVTVVTSAVADGLDPDAALRRHAAHIAPRDLDAVLAAHAGFLVAGGLATMPPGLEPIAAAKRRLGAAAVRWLRDRLGPITG